MEVTRWLSHVPRPSTQQSHMHRCESSQYFTWSSVFLFAQPGLGPRQPAKPASQRKCLGTRKANRSTHTTHKIAFKIPRCCARAFHRIPPTLSTAQAASYLPLTASHSGSKRTSPPLALTLAFQVPKRRTNPYILQPFRLHLNSRCSDHQPSGICALLLLIQAAELIEKDAAT